ncbi:MULTISPECIES: hypothetical protein [Bifidobacterium]|uniref:Uncharacterized protein n=1 Tax=Bifidobacterium choerinum TaxID=35760 RepID=A0A087AH83_9BIFI|nr:MULTISPECIES: hypothetical protein [Bifidobacterium]KFI58133.1 hypothetical protein BCHO_0216 [Bifidobacterium choerinum]
MSMMAPSLAESPLVRFTIPEREYVGDGIPRAFNGKPLPWVAELEKDAAEGRDDYGREDRS